MSIPALKISELFNSVVFAICAARARLTLGQRRTVGAIGAAGRECVSVVRRLGYSPRGRGSYGQNRNVGGIGKAGRDYQI